MSQGAFPTCEMLRLLDEKAVAIILVCILSSIILLGTSGGPPLVEISDVQTIEDGMTVKVVGSLVDLRTYDSGSESMIIASLNDRTTIKVVSTPGVKPQPSAYAHVGDELQIDGEIGNSGTVPVIFTTSDDVTRLRRSEQVLTVEVVSNNWLLFEGDVIRIKGILRTTGVGVGIRFYDCADRYSIAIMSNDHDLTRYVGSTVTLTATLYFDHRLNALALEPITVLIGK